MNNYYRFHGYVRREDYQKAKKKGYSHRDILVKAIEMMRDLGDGFGAGGDMIRRCIMTKEAPLAREFQREIRRTGYTESEIIRMAVNELAEEW